MRAEWATVRIGDVCEIATGGTPSRSNPEYFGGNIKWLVSGDIHLGEICDCEGRITEAGMRNSNAKLLSPNSVMIALNGQGKTRGSVALLRTSATCNQSLVCMTPKLRSGLMPEFLCANLQGRYEEIRRLTSDDDKDRRGLNMGIVRNIRIPMPPIEVQMQIVEVLNMAFSGLAITQSQAVKNAQNARALFESRLQAAFSGLSEGSIRRRLAEMCDIKHGYAFDGAEFSSSVSRDRPIIITPGNFTEEATLSFTDRNTKRFSGTVPEDYRFTPGDLVVVMTDLSSKMKILGKPAFVESPNVLHNQRIGRFIFLSDDVEKRYVYYFLRTEAYLKQIRLSATGTMVKHTAPKRILSTVLPFPPNRADQLEIVTQLDALAAETQRLMRLYEKKQAALTELKQSILYRAFAGQLIQAA